MNGMVEVQLPSGTIRSSTILYYQKKVELSCVDQAKDETQIEMQEQFFGVIHFIRTMLRIVPSCAHDVVYDTISFSP